jgi:hypothetical protein
LKPSLVCWTREFGILKSRNAILRSQNRLRDLKSTVLGSKKCDLGTSESRRARLRSLKPSVVFWTRDFGILKPRNAILSSQNRLRDLKSTVLGSENCDLGTSDSRSARLRSLKPSLVFWTLDFGILKSGNATLSSQDRLRDRKSTTLGFESWDPGVSDSRNVRLRSLGRF